MVWMVIYWTVLHKTFILEFSCNLLSDSWVLYQFQQAQKLCITPIVNNSIIQWSPEKCNQSLLSYYSLKKNCFRLLTANFTGRVRRWTYQLSMIGHCTGASCLFGYVWVDRWLIYVLFLSFWLLHRAQLIHRWGDISYSQIGWYLHL